MKINAVLSLSIVLLAGCASRSGQHVASTGRSLQPVALGASDQNVTLLPNQRKAYVALRENRTVTVPLEVNERAGYSWELADRLDEKVLKLVSPDAQTLAPVALSPDSAAGSTLVPRQWVYKAPPVWQGEGKKPVSAPVPQQWVFKAVGPGTAKVRMRYTRLNQPLSEAIFREFTVNVE
ncbi:MAG: hypothetical protein QOE70_3982 [Chthoniobacter sp.]|jgi:predicted secreted protein|nr:hypothetical protein [Chthoniobacter sp.]